MGMNLLQAERAVLINARAGNATLVTSPSGYGKSTMGFQAFSKFKAEKEKHDKTVGLGIIFLATQTPPDLIGYQFKRSRKVTMPNGEVREITVAHVPLSGSLGRAL